MKVTELEKDVPFDQFSRQYQVTDIINDLRSKKGTFKILDVGGYKGRTADFLPEDEVVILDLFAVKEKNYVRGSALDMPFPDGSFDFVVSFDVLEHIPPESRNKFLDECNRVARIGVIICAPQRTPANEYAEQSLNELYKKLHKKPHRWLKEHIEYGIPDFNALESHAKSKSLHTVRFTSNKTQLFVSMQQAIFMNSKYPLASEQLVQANTYYNQNFTYDGGGSEEAAYRLILVCLKSKQAAQTVERRRLLSDKPIDSIREIKLLETIGAYNLALTQKTDTLAGNYKNLHEHERTRAEILQANNEKLHSQVAHLLERIDVRIVRKVKSSIHKNKK